MAGLSADRPSEVVLAARVARQFYLDGASKIDIAESLGISRFRVARLLESARDSGMVRIAPSCHSHRETCQTAEPRGPEIRAVRTLDACPCRVDASHRCDGLTGNV